MDIFEVNSWDYGSTGKIMLQIAAKAREKGFTVQTSSSKWNGRKLLDAQKNNRNHYYFGSFLSSALHYILGCRFGILGLLSVFSTLKLCRKIKKADPQIIHLHNLHD